MGIIMMKIMNFKTLYSNYPGAELKYDNGDFYQNLQWYTNHLQHDIIMTMMMKLSILWYY